MEYEAMLDEVDQLNNVSKRLEGLAEQDPPASKALIAIAGNVRGTASVLEVLIAIKRYQSDGHTLSDYKILNPRIV